MNNNKNTPKPGANATSENPPQTPPGEEAPPVTALRPQIVSPFAGMDFTDLGFSEDELKTLTGMDQLGPGEIRIPYANLIAKPDNAGHKVGDIVFADDTVISGLDKGEFVEELSILKVQPVRVMFPTPFKSDNSFICRSIDGKVGHTDGEYPGQDCATCPYSVYPEKGGASPCRDQRLLLMTKADGSLFHMQVAGVAMGPWKNFMSAQLFHNLAKVNNVLGAFRISLHVKMMQTDNGPFPAQDFRINPRAPYVDRDRLVANLQAYKAYKEFEKQYAETAALHTKAAMAAGQDSEATGPNTQMF